MKNADKNNPYSPPNQSATTPNDQTKRTICKSHFSFLLLTMFSSLSVFYLGLAILALTSEVVRLQFLDAILNRETIYTAVFASTILTLAVGVVSTFASKIGLKHYLFLAAVLMVKLLTACYYWNAMFFL